MDLFIFLFVTVLSIIIIVVIGLLLITVSWHLFVLKCPFVPTNRATARAMVAMAGLRGHERVYDLGAGDGAVLIEAKRAHPGITATGVEKVFTVYWLGKLRIWFSRQKVDLRLGDIFAVDLSTTDVIFLYLIPHLMEKLEKKFDAELKPGTVVISHAFQFPNKIPVTQTLRENGPKILRYEW